MPMQHGSMGKNLVEEESWKEGLNILNSVAANYTVNTSSYDTHFGILIHMEVYAGV